MQVLVSASEIIAALGGDHRVAAKYDRSTQCVRNWRYGRGIPLALRPIVDDDLRRIGKKSTLAAFSRPLKLPLRSRRMPVSQ